MSDKDEVVSLDAPASIQKAYTHQIEFLRHRDVDDALRSVAATTALALTPPQIATLFDRLKDWEHIVRDLHANLRTRLIQYAKSRGGPGKYVVDGWQLEVRQRHQVDAGKLEGIIRAKGKNPQMYMTPEVTYKVSEAGLKLLVHDKVMTEAEIDTCRPADQYTVMTPKRAGDETNE